MKLLWRLAQCGVVLLDKIPANFVLREIIARCSSSGRISWNRGGRVLLSSTLVLILLGEAAIACHYDCGNAEIGRLSSLSDRWKGSYSGVGVN